MSVAARRLSPQVGTLRIAATTNTHNPAFLLKSF